MSSDVQTQAQGMLGWGPTTRPGMRRRCCGSAKWSWPLNSRAKRPVPHWLNRSARIPLMITSTLDLWMPQDMGGCQNYDPFLGALNIRCRIIMGIQKGTIILTTTLLPYNPYITHYNSFHFLFHYPPYNPNIYFPGDSTCTPRTALEALFEPLRPGTP